MSGRLEYKYLVPNELLDPVRAALLPFMESDPFVGDPNVGEYTVRSIYYDTPRFACYLEKMDGLEARQKFRIRGYGEAGEGSIVFLEIKTKKGSMVGKHRAPLLHTALGSFLASPDIDRDIIHTTMGARALADARRFLYYYYRFCLRPTVLVVYDREPFFGKFDSSLRVTFDKNLRGVLLPTLSNLYEEQGLFRAMANYFILELKFFRGALPVWVPRIVQRFALPRMALSKYTICVDQGQAHGGAHMVRRSTAPPSFASA